MKSNKVFYGKLLAHTTFLTLININFSIAATTQVSNNVLSPLSNSGSWSNGPFVSGDNIKFGGNHNILFDQPGYFVDFVDTNGYQGGKISVQSQTAVGRISRISNAAGGSGLTSIEFTNDIELFLNGNNYNSTDYSALSSIAPSASLGSGKGIVNLGILTGNDQNITFNIGTASLKVDKVSSTAFIQPYTASNTSIGYVNIVSGRTILKSGHEIHANQYILTPKVLWNDTDVSNYQIDNILELEDNTIVNADIITRRGADFDTILDQNSGSGGRVIVDAGATLTGNLGTTYDPLEEVRFDGTSPTKIVHLYGNINSGEVIIRQPTLMIEANLTISGEITGSDSNIDLKDKTLVLGYNDVFYNYTYYNPPPVTFIGDLAIRTTIGDSQFGKIIVDGVKEFVDLSETDHLNINLVDGTTSLPGTAGRSYTVLGTTSNGGTINIISDDRVSFLRLPGGNPFVNWSYSNGVVTQTAKSQAEINQIIKNLLAQSGSNGNTVTNVISLVNPNNTGQASALGNNVITIAIIDPLSLGKDISRLEPVIVEATEGTFIDIKNAAATISEHLSSISAPTRFRVASQQDGVAAAGESSNYGAWGSVYYSEATQRGRKQNPGYKTNTIGSTIGVDTYVNDTTMLGVAFSIMKAKMDHKDDNLGDKTHANGYLFSLYGLKELSSKWFVQSIFSAGTNKINNREKRREGNVYNIARGSYSVTNYGAEALVGYEYEINESLMLTPLGGISYNVIGDSWYQETGTAFSNFLITKKADHKSEAILGTRLTMAKDWNGFALVPEVHGMFRYDMLNRSPNVTVRIDGLVNQMVPRTREANRSFFNLGAGVNASKGRTEYGLTYDGYFANKYVGNQLTLKLRVNI